jgi:predicted TPR repeat methyltransferase
MLSLSSKKEHWDQLYETSPHELRSWHQSVPAISLRMIESTRIGSHARVLDVGGGTSILVDCLLDISYRRVGLLDISEVAVAAARRRLGIRDVMVEWYTMDVTRFISPHPWDIWHDRGLLHYLTDGPDRAAYVHIMRRYLAPGGQVIIAGFGPSGPQQCSGLPTVRYSAASLGAQLGHGFSLVESVPESHVTPGGKVQQFLYNRFVRAHDLF